MADERPDESQKTEEPTQKRLQEAHQKGQVAKSQEVGHWFMILAFTIMVGFLAPGVGREIGDALYRFIARPHTIQVDDASIQDLLGALAANLGMALLAMIALAIAAALASGFLQTGFILTTEPIKPKLERISPLSGLKRLFSTRAMVEFLKGIAKLSIVASVIALVLWPERHLIYDLVSMELPEFLAVVQSLAVQVLGAVLAVMTVIAGLDFLFQKQQHAKQLRMTKQEVKDEFKQSEGDPMVKARLRQIRTERARQRMMAAVPEADVVIANPTHFAVALAYELGSAGAPKVTAKGVDTLALRMRELAEESGVPVVENPPLARALYGAVDLNQEIPSEHYKAVAEIIGYVMRLKGKLPGQPAGLQRGRE